MRTEKTAIVIAILFLGLIPSLCRAAEPPPAESFALVVGSNRAGGGQEPLSYALADADRFTAVLSELGGYPPANITTLHDPGADEIAGALSHISHRVEKYAEAGTPTSFVFFYSGHARAFSVNMGAEEIPLDRLRGMVDAIPADFKMIVLDACQSGAISKVKGISPAVNFSYNSVNGLSQKGLVVIAASAASELAQESTRLKGSFFTHHLVTALRGAADANRDGLITLDEAYRYTYNRTLLDTAKTAVGKQHVTLETALRGKGETVLSRPQTTKTLLSLPAAFEGEVLISRNTDKQVMAEVHKTPGNRMTLALPPSIYDIVIRKKGKGYSCPTTLTAGAAKFLNTEACDRIVLDRPVAKGGGPRPEEHLFFEVGLGILLRKSDAYNQRLSEFELSRDDDKEALLNFSVSAYYSVLRYLKIGLMYGFLDNDNYSGTYDSFSWRAHRIGLSLRGVLPMAGDRIGLYLQLEGGLAFAGTDYTRSDPLVIIEGTNPPAGEFHQRYWGFHLSGGGGIRITPWQYFGFFSQIEYIHAPIIENLIGDKHNSGGVALSSGLMGGF